MSEYLSSARRGGDVFPCPTGPRRRSLARSSDRPARERATAGTERPGAAPLRPPATRRTDAARPALTERRSGVVAAPGMREVAAMLARRIEELATDLVGEAPTASRRGEVRFRRRGSLVVFTAGPRRGVWFDHNPPAGGRAPGRNGAAGGDALDLVAHLRCCERREALAWARTWLGEEAPCQRLATPSGASAATTATPRRAASGTLDFARRIWREAIPTEGTPVEAYFAGRGLRLPAGALLRFHHECPRGRDERWPAMLALMTDPITGAPRGVHRTFLAGDGSGKAPGPMPAKMMAGPAGVVRLVPDAEVTLGLGLTEGIENALAVMQRYRWGPVWAAGSAGGIASFPVLPGVEALTVFADADDSGASVGAARRCAARWRRAGRRVWLVLPRPGEDFNDVLRRAAP